MRVTCQTVWPAIFYQQGPDLDSTLVPTWCQAPVWTRERKTVALCFTQTQSQMVFFSAQEESEPDAIHAPICVIFNTHTQKGIKKKLQTKKNTHKKSTVHCHPLSACWATFRPISCYHDDSRRGYIEPTFPSFNLFGVKMVRLITIQFNVTTHTTVYYILGMTTPRCYSHAISSVMLM